MTRPKEPIGPITDDDEVVHICPPGSNETACGAPRSIRHKGHWASSGPVPKYCSCGTPICSACRNILNLYE